MKRIVIISNYFHFAQEKASNRYRELAELLSAEPDIEVEVITSSFYQRTYQHRTNCEELVKDIPYKAHFAYEPGYKKSISPKRIISQTVFAKNVMRYLKAQPKPDLIYQVFPTPEVANSVSCYAKKHGIPLIVDIQDLWPEAFKMALNIPVINDVLFAPYNIMANSIYKRADALCAVSKTYIERAKTVNKTCNDTQAVYIGINLKKFDENVQKNKREKDSQISLAYCGSLSTSYDIRLVIDALSLMKNPPKFIVMGGGNDLEPLKEYAKNKNVDAEFTGFLPYEEMCGILCSCDITVNPIVGTSVASIINKHGDYAASGLPVINTQNSDEYCNLVNEYQMGINAVGCSAPELAQKIQLLMDNEDVRLQMGKNARRCAEEKFDRAVTYPEIVKTVRKFL